jgi:hypothetical protein
MGMGCEEDGEGEVFRYKVMNVTFVKMDNTKKCLQPGPNPIKKYKLFLFNFITLIYCFVRHIGCNYYKTFKLIDIMVIFLQMLVRFCFL